MTLDAALVLIAELQAQNAQLREQNAALQARVAALEQRIAELEAAKSTPPWVKANRVKREKPAGEKRRQRAHNAGRGHPCPSNATPLRYLAFPASRPSPR